MWSGRQCGETTGQGTLEGERGESRRRARVDYLLQQHDYGWSKKRWSFEKIINEILTHSKACGVKDIQVRRMYEESVDE